MSIENTVKEISEILGCDFGPADPHDLESLRSLGLPEVVVGFFESFEPKDVEVLGVENHSISTIIKKSKAWPGRILCAKGYLVFASDDGVSCCFNLNAQSPQTGPSIVLIGHDSVTGIEEGDAIPKVCQHVAQGIEGYWRKARDGVVEAQRDGLLDD